MSSDSPRRYALVLDPADNVATLLFDAANQECITLKGAEGDICAHEEIRLGHKIALCAINAGESIVKYGQKIGYALSDISAGDWVHLHNMASVLDSDFKRRIGQ